MTRSCFGVYSLPVIKFDLFKEYFTAGVSTLAFFVGSFSWCREIDLDQYYCCRELFFLVFVFIYTADNFFLISRVVGHYFYSGLFVTFV